MFIFEIAAVNAVNVALAVVITHNRIFQIFTVQVDFC